MNKKKIYRAMEAAVLRGVFPGAVLLCAKDQEVILHKAFGVANRFDKKRMAKNSIFDLASLTKPLATTLAIASLMATRPGFLNRKISTLLKEFQNTDKADITIDMLLRHRSGYPAHKKFFLQVQNRRNPARALRKYLVTQALENPVNKKTVYSDLGFMVLSWVIETTTGQRLDQFVHERVYRPMGIDALFFIPKESRDRILKQYETRLVATQHCPWRNRLLVGEVDDENAWVVGGVDGQAGLFGDARSVFLICRELMAALTGAPARGVDPGVIRCLVQKQDGHEKAAGFDIPSKINSSAGRYFSDASIGHLGFTGTSFWMDPRSSIIIVLLTNRVHPTRSNGLIKGFRPEIHNLINTELA